MSRFFTENLSRLKPYVPGEQPKDQQYIKLNTNEAPYGFDELITAAVSETFHRMSRYPDPEVSDLVRCLAEYYKVDSNQIIPGNGSDDILNFIVKAFCDDNHPALFPDITYGFYKVIAEVNNVPYRQVPLREDLSIQVKDYADQQGVIFLANPNAPTGMMLTVGEITMLLEQDRNRLVVVDEAYGEFGAESVIPLTKKYDNLLVVKTFSKAWGLAGGRLGFAIGQPDLIRDLNTIRYSTNPYNVNRMTEAAGCALLNHADLVMTKVQEVIEQREKTAEALKDLGFVLTDSRTNFVFAKHPDISGEDLYLKLKARGILIRHFSDDRIADYNRITIGSDEEMTALIGEIREILTNRAINHRYKQWMKQWLAVSS